MPSSSHTIQTCNEKIPIKKFQWRKGALLYKLLITSGIAMSNLYK
jgi:hypothetical protein